MRNDQQPRERALAPLVGQILLFALVTTTVFAITTTAVPIITEEQSSIQHEQAKDSLKEIDAILTTAAKTNQSGEHAVDVPAGTIQLGGTEAEITVSNATRTHTFHSQPLRMATNDKEVVSEAGLIASTHENPPRVPQIESTPTELRVPDTETYQIHFVTVNQTGTGNRITKGQAGNLEFQARPTGAAASTIEDGNMTVESEHPQMWQRYLRNHTAFGNVSRAGTTVTAEIDTDTKIRISVSRLSIT